MRIGCLQFAPVKGDINNNLSRADAVLLKADTDNLDLIVLPELAFSGRFPVRVFFVREKGAMSKPSNYPAFASPHTSHNTKCV